MKDRFVVIMALTFIVAIASAPAHANSQLSWEGFYTGVNAGYAWNDGDLTSCVGTMSSDEDDSFTGGALFGYNHLFGPIVVGIEADLNYAKLKQSEHIYTDYGYAYDNYHDESEIEWFGTVRPRLGYAPSDSLLVYATAGLAYGKAEIKSNFTVVYPGFPEGDGSVSGSRSDTRSGWTLGAGTEYSVKSNLSVKMEYLYVDLGSETNEVNGSYWDGSPISYTVEDDAKFSTLRIGLNYHF